VLRDLCTRYRPLCWRLARIGMVTATVVVFLGGVLAGPARHLSDLFVLAAFGILIPSVALAWLGLPVATHNPSLQIATAQERHS
jgi:hypothetical protein